MKRELLLSLLLALVLLSACSGKYDAADNGFDKICLIYEDILNDPAYAKRPRIDKYVLVSEAVQKYVTDVDAITAYTAVASAEPNLKYQLFKEAAEMSLKRAWDCEAIKNEQAQKAHEKT